MSMTLYICTASGYRNLPDTKTYYICKKTCLVRGNIFQEIIINNTFLFRILSFRIATGKVMATAIGHFNT